MTGRVLPRSARLPLVYSFTPAWGPACPCVERVRASKTYVMCADPAGCYFRRFAAGVLSLSRSEGPRFAAPVAIPAPGLRWRCNSFSVEARLSKKKETKNRKKRNKKRRKKKILNSKFRIYNLELVRCLKSLQIVDFLRKITDKIIDFRQRLEERLKNAPDRGLSKENH